MNLPKTQHFESLLIVDRSLPLLPCHGMPLRECNSQITIEGYGKNDLDFFKRKEPDG